MWSRHENKIAPLVQIYFPSRTYPAVVFQGLVRLWGEISASSPNLHIFIDFRTLNIHEIEIFAIIFSMELTPARNKNNNKIDWVFTSVTKGIQVLNFIQNCWELSDLLISGQDFFC